MNNNTNNSLAPFIGGNSVSKTLRNELRVGSEYTRKHIIEYGIIAEDAVKAENQYTVKEMMDDFYRDFIDRKLDALQGINWEQLFDIMKKVKLDKNDKTSKELDKIQESIRKEIGKIFSSDPIYKDMLKADMISKILPEYIVDKYDDAASRIEAVKVFYGFAGYFIDFWASRKNIFSDTNIASAIPYRIVNENARIHMENITAFNRIAEIAGDEVAEIAEDASAYLQNMSLEDVFTGACYGEFICQKDIDRYNNICGVINQHMNQFCQNKKISRSKFKMERLHKQILCRSESGFEIPVGFQTDGEVIDAINSFSTILEEKDILNRLRTLSQEVTGYDMERIYVSSKAFESVSKYIDHKWDVIASSMYNYFSGAVRGKDDKKDAKIQTEIKKIKSCSLLDLKKLVDMYYKMDGMCLEHEATEYVAGITEILVDFNYKTFDMDDSVKMIQNEQMINEIKEYLDTYMSIYHWAKDFMVDEFVDRDMEFYSELDEIYYDLSDIVPLYNKVRNYVTQKPYSQDKIKLNFGSPTLANGWSKSKEFDNNVVVLLRDEKIYLAILNVGNKPSKDIMAGEDRRRSDTDYKKMNYYLLPGASKTLPHVFISSNAWKKSHGIPDEIMYGYNQNKHLKSSPNFDLEFCHKLIDYYKECIDSYPNYQIFNFKFAATDTYNDISAFYKDVERQGYKIEWSYISEDDINQMDRDGQIYLFQIYNKDFAPNSKGMQNLHTMFLKNIFSEENLSDVVIKLNGEAELFFRKSSIQHKRGHKKGSVLVNKTYKTTEKTENGQGEIEVIESLPDQCYMELVKYWSEGGVGQLSEEASKYKDKVSHYAATMDIVKDRRYTEDKFFIHLPITINFKADNRNNVNEKVLKFIAENDDLHVIGIDRGERNLLYVSVIDSRGRIVEQKSFNIVENHESSKNVIRRHDYKGKLVNKEKYRNEARKSWKEIGKIKEIKEGYLSQVIHEISKLVLKYNAIIVMEDLNYGFKRGRFKVERQVYQKFETMLINKLAYLVDKSRAVDEPGGLLKGYQLTYVPDNLSELGSQCGIIFYVPAAYTSKIDPVTGFVDVFDFKAYSNAEARLDFINKLDCIRYDASRNKFEIAFDYGNFRTHHTTLAKTSWTIFIQGDRIKKERGSYGWKDEIIDIEARIRKLFEDTNIEYADGHNLIGDINELESPIQKKFVGELFDIIRFAVQLRNSKSEKYDGTEKEYDKIISPVMDEEGVFFTTDSYIRADGTELPKDADANGAYCIALKGLYDVLTVKKYWKEGEKFDRKLLAITNYKWFDFIQNRRF